MKHFIVVGAQRCGTTLLYQLLNQHHAIHMIKPVRPEPKFFLYAGPNTQYKEYQRKYFASLRPSIECVGEKSTSYIESEHASNYIKKIIPDAKILIMLRDPVLRAISNYKFSVDNQLEHRAFPEAIKNEPSQSLALSSTKEVSVNPFDYMQRGFYINYVKNYIELFGFDSVKVIILEKLISSHYSLNYLYEWLGLSPVNQSFICKQSRINKSSTSFEPELKVMKEIGSQYLQSIHDLEAYLGINLNIWIDMPWYKV